MNRWPALLLASLLGLALACALDDELENADCLTNADCWTNQDCVRTMVQSDMQIPGLCRPKGSGCAVGEQLGCACAVDTTGQRTCSATEGYLIPSTDDENCVCLSEAAATSTS